MQHKLPRYISGHFSAILGVVGLYAGLAVWAMYPAEPVAVPQQQVIQIAMIRAAAPEKTTKQEKQQEPTKIPKAEGLKKAELKSKIKPELKKDTDSTKKTALENLAKPLPPAPTSGPQNVEATEKQAAITEPSYNASYLNNPSPEYPFQAKRRGIQGTVMLEVKVTVNGQAKEVSIYRSSGSKLLDEAARKAVYRWSFVPAHRGAEPVEATVLVPIEFKLS